MSLNISPELIQQAEVGEVDTAAFIAAIRESLPYAWGVVESLAHGLHQEGKQWANHAVSPPNEQCRAQLLRMMGGDAIRRSVEQHFNLKLAFQNCHNVAAFQLDAVNSPTYVDFISVRQQILNQTPALRDC